MNTALLTAQKPELTENVIKDTIEKNLKQVREQKIKVKRQDLKVGLKRSKRMGDTNFR